MRILLIGEYSRLHNSLKEGLVHLKQDVTLVGSGDGFKQYPVDFSIAATFCEKRIVKIFRKLIFLLFNFDISKIERGIKFYLLLPQLKNFDIVQLINEMPIQTVQIFELFLLKKIKNNNHKLYLLSAGVDYQNVRYMTDNPEFKSVLQPFFENPSLKKHFDYIFEYNTKQSKKIHEYLYQVCNGVIASDIDYQLPLRNNPKFLELIPNPINTSILNVSEKKIEQKIVIFLGINRWNYHAKGIVFFEEALQKIQKKYPESVEIIIIENLPYSQYIHLYNSAAIVLDQIYAHDQGYNALEAMAKGKVVFTGAAIEFEKYYNLENAVAINSLPDCDYLVDMLSRLIENPKLITEISENAVKFIHQYHDYIKIAGKYLEVWDKN
jgi:glycosyltransferase involved in cell wall biosynthesis